MKQLGYLLSFTILTALFSQCTTSTASDEASENLPWIAFDTPESQGMSIESLQGIDEIIKKMTEHEEIPGAAALVAKNGKVLYHTAFGFQDLESKSSCDTSDIFRIASMTKPIVSVATMKLYEDGKLQLTDPISKYIPGFKNTGVLDTFNAEDTTWTTTPASREITVHDLLTHTSGINYAFMDQERYGPIFAKKNIPDLAVASERKIEEVATLISETPLVHNPGEKFSYGLSIDVLGRVVEVASGQTLGAYVRENITMPLKMNDTRFFFDTDVSERLMSVYLSNPEDTSLIEMKPDGIYDPDYPNSGAKTYFSGGSGMSSTTLNYFVFCQMILNGGSYQGVQILKPETVALMTSNQIGELDAWGKKFGYGFEIMKEGDEVVHLSWSGAFNTWFYINPKDQVIGIIMSQVLFNPFGGELIKEFKTSIEGADQS